MKHIKLGKSDLLVSNLCFGAMLFGSKVPEDISFKLLDMYIDNGGNFIDTSNNYAHWVEGCVGHESERLLGRYLKLRGNRDNLVIATKVGYDRKGVGAGLKKEQIVYWVEESLKNLKTDYIDIYYSHVDDFNTPIEESMEAFDALVKAGKVRYLGASNWYSWRLERAKQICIEQGYARHICVQLYYTYLQTVTNDVAGHPRGVQASREMLDWCEAEQVPLIAYCALAGGCYDRDDKPFPDILVKGKRLDTLKAMAKAYNVSATQLSLAWMIQCGYPVIPLTSASKVSQLESILEAFHIKITPKDISILNNA